MFFRRPFSLRSRRDHSSDPAPPLRHRAALQRGAPGDPGAAATPSARAFSSLPAPRPEPSPILAAYHVHEVRRASVIPPPVADPSPSPPSYLAQKDYFVDLEGAREGAGERPFSIMRGYLREEEFDAPSDTSHLDRSTSLEQLQTLLVDLRVPSVAQGDLKPLLARVEAAIKDPQWPAAWQSLYPRLLEGVVHVLSEVVEHDRYCSEVDECEAILSIFSGMKILPASLDCQVFELLLERYGALSRTLAASAMTALRLIVSNKRQAPHVLAGREKCFAICRNLMFDFHNGDFAVQFAGSRLLTAVCTSDSASVAMDCEIPALLTATLMDNSSDESLRTSVFLCLHKLTLAVEHSPAALERLVADGQLIGALAGFMALMPKNRSVWQCGSKSMACLVEHVPSDLDEGVEQARALDAATTFITGLRLSYFDFAIYTRCVEGLCVLATKNAPMLNRLNVISAIECYLPSLCRSVALTHSTAEINNVMRLLDLILQVDAPLPRASSVLLDAALKAGRGGCTAGYRVYQRLSGINEREPESHSREALEQHLCCPVCKDLVLQPVVAHCGHHFCAACLFSWIAQSQGRPLCPVCREQIRTVFDSLRAVALIGELEAVGWRRDAADCTTMARVAIPPRPYFVS